jgi:hypothetical protein
METKYTHTMGSDPDGKYFLVAEDGWVSESYDNKWDLFIKIGKRAVENAIELENAISLIEELRYIFLPILPRDYYLNEELNHLDEMAALNSMQIEIFEMCLDLEILNLKEDHFPCLVALPEDPKVVKIYYIFCEEDEADMKEDEDLERVESSEGMTSINEIENWLKVYGAINKIDPQQQQAILHKAIDLGIPKYEKVILLKKEDFKYQFDTEMNSMGAQN